MPGDIGADLVTLLPRLRRYALALCRSGEFADDLVQMACERALATKAHRAPDAPFDAWMFTILRNVWLDGLRRVKQEGVVDDIADHPELMGTDGDRDMEARLTLHKVRKQIDLLPDEQREVLFLVCVENLSYKDAAQMLSIPIGTVMSRLARARGRLAEHSGWLVPPASS